MSVFKLKHWPLGDKVDCMCNTETRLGRFNVYFCFLYKNRWLIIKTERQLKDNNLWDIFVVNLIEDRSSNIFTKWIECNNLFLRVTRSESNFADKVCIRGSWRNYERRLLLRDALLLLYNEHANRRRYFTISTKHFKKWKHITHSTRLHLKPYSYLILELLPQ